MSESVKILIEADDQASQKIAAAAKNVEASVKNIKSTGDQAKKSTEFIGAIAGALGGSEIASYAGQLAGLTDKVSQFSEIQKAGGAGAFAFKAGLVAATGAIAFGIGNAIGNVIFQTAAWTEKMKEATAQADKLAAAAMKFGDVRFSEAREDIELIRDPDAKQAAYEQLLGKLNKDIAGVEAQAKQSKKAADEWAAAWQITGDRKGFAEQAKKENEQDKERLAQLSDQRAELEKLLNERTKNNELLKEENALKDKSDAYLKSLQDELELLSATKDEAIEINAARNTADEASKKSAASLLSQIELIKEKNEAEKKAESDRLAAAAKASSEAQAIAAKDAAYLANLKYELDMLQAIGDETADIEAARGATSELAKAEAAELIRQRDAIKAAAEEEKKIAKEKEQAAAKQAADAQKLSDLKQSELDNLKQQRIEMEQGKEAAQAFALEKKGLSEADAKSIAKQQAELDALKAGPAKKTEAPPELKAFESRLLTRGSGQDPSVQIASNTAMAATALKAIQAMQQDDRRERAIRLKVMK
jgi:hypothetical protein